jgi:hypothetical protein
MPFAIKVTVFSSSGEKVALLFNGGVSQMPGSPTLVGSVLQPGFAGVDLNFLGTLSSGGNNVAWLGLSDGGSVVKGGIYYFSVESVDSFGKITTYTIPINVIAPKGANEINIFNSAGELVYHESFNSLTATATDLALDALSFAPAMGKLNGQLRSAAGASSPWSWDGRGSDGRLLSSGIYTIQLSSPLPGQASKPVIYQVQLLDAPEARDASPRAVYVPGGFLIRYDASAVAGGLHARLYNMAGELAGQAGPSGTPGELGFEAGGMASGIYIVVLEYQSPTGARKRSVIKAAILH